jgi:catechol 2,3-dioxygenase-like lactoylglutathione lyase family enzyme
MTTGIDHVTIVVTDLDEARRFFSLLGLEETTAVVIAGDAASRYMDIPDWESDHVTLRLPDAPGHQEIQLLRFHRPVLEPDETPDHLDRLGLNHLCLAVSDLGATLETLQANGFRTRNEMFEYHDRKLVFLNGPGRVVIELAEHNRATTSDSTSVTGAS